MAAKWSIDEVLGNLESQAGFFREREAFHARQEEHHRAQRSAFAAELAKVSQHLEAFRAAAGAAMELAGRDVTPPAAVLDEDLGSASRPHLGRMVEMIIAALPVDTRFGVKLLAAEVNRRFGERLRRPVEERQVSVVLRRLTRKRRLDLVRPGRPHWEALYVRTPAP